MLISGTEAQTLLPGICPLKAIETLPGVIYETADPWGTTAVVTSNSGGYQAYPVPPRMLFVTFSANLD